MAAELDRILRVRLLGPVAAWRGDERLDLGPGRQRAVFAVLAAQAGQVVPRDVLISEVWGESPPPAASNSLYSYISRLRRVLTREVLVSAGDGYSLRLEPGALDVPEFDRLRQLAQYCWNRRDIAGARTALDAALALWHGDALEGVDGPFAEPYRKRLAELRLATVERRAEAMIASAEAGAINELRRLTELFPRRETLTGLLMTALRRAGQVDEAIEVFDETRRMLVEQLGIEPGAALRRIHRELTAGERPDRPARARPVRGKPDILVGRGAELATLRSRLADLRRGRGGTVWIEGGAGTGKSGLLAAALGQPDLTYELLWAEADESRRGLPLRLMLSCLGIDRRSADPRRVELAEALATPPPEQSPWQPELMAVDRLAGFVDQLTAAGPVVLVLDDLQWADDASLLVWHRLGKAARHSPLLLIGAARPLPRRPEIDRLRSAVAAGGDLLRLGTLGEPETGELISRLLGAQPGEALSAVADCAAGNPLFLRELIAALVRDGLVRIDDGTAEVTALDELDSPALRAVLTRRHAALTESTREALRWAALLGDEFDLADLSRVLGRPALDLIPAVEEAIAAGVLREAGTWFTFRHPLLRQALYTAMPVPVRTALHRQAAQLLAESGAPVEHVAGQLLAAPVGMAGWVADWLVGNVNAMA
ncbi:MAG: BTAD domain-containing putative transcriptional regulator, partial [Kibdelosporangium sp.]